MSVQPLVAPAHDGHKKHHRTELSEDTKWATVDGAWDALMDEPEGNRVFFDHIVIAGDGGLSEIGVKEELWYNSRYFSSFILVVFVIYNIYFVLEVDIHILVDTLQNTTQLDNDYLISKAILEYVRPESEIQPKSVIASIELLALAYYIIVLLWDIGGGFFRKDHAQWKAISEVCWIDLPDLSIFSAMKLLAYIVPQKLSYDLNYAIWYDTGSKVKNVLWIVLTRPILLIIGMDCFLVKYRGASAYIMLDDASTMDILGGVIFLNQVLGVVNITYTIKSRLYRFVFGGEDGIMSERELVRQDVWESFVAFKIFERYPKGKAISMMLSWCDDDFQMLALNEKAGDFNAIKGKP